MNSLNLQKFKSMIKTATIPYEVRFSLGNQFYSHCLPAVAVSQNHIVSHANTHIYYFCEMPAADEKRLFCPCVCCVGLPVLWRTHDGHLRALCPHWGEVETEPTPAGASQAMLRCKPRDKRPNASHPDAG